MLENRRVDLDSLVSCCEERSLPEFVVRHGRNVVAAERKAILSNLSSFGCVYGFNTLTGHRDDVSFSGPELQGFNDSVLDSHCIGRGPWFSEREVGYLVFSKLHSFSLGGSGVSLSVFDGLCAAWDRRSVFSARIPRLDSYSSGDVIPGAHLAHFLRHSEGCEFEVGDMIAVINGSYVHAGYALSVRQELATSLDELLHTIARSLSVVEVGAEWVSRLKLFLDVCCPENSRFDDVSLSKKSTGKQLSVSFRGIPEMIQALWLARRGFDEALIDCFSCPSANPLFVNGGQGVVSQASFLRPELSLASSKLIDALHFSAWQALRRICFMLNPASGNLLDASSGGLDLGLIQVPKRLQARLDQQRLLSGVRPFCMGSSASNGIEDCWTYGVFLVYQLKEMIALVREMLLEEAAVAEYIKRVERGEKVKYRGLVEEAGLLRGLRYD